MNEVTSFLLSANSSNAFAHCEQTLTVRCCVFVPVSWRHTAFMAVQPAEYKYSVILCYFTIYSAYNNHKHYMIIQTN